MSRLHKFIILLPLLYSLLFSFAVYIGVNSAARALTPEARQLMMQEPFDLFTATLFNLLPGGIISLILLNYGRSHPEKSGNTLILCFCSLAVATLMSLYILQFYYSTLNPEISGLPLLMYGFPVTYLFGLFIGWAAGLLIVGLRK